MSEGPLFPGGINAFIELKDTPASFVGQSGKTPIVKATEDELEFTTLVGGDMLAATYDPASKSEQLLGESDIVTTISNPGSDTKVPSEQGTREALDVINQRKIKDQYYRIIASGNTTGTLTKPAGAGADVDFIMDGWGVSVDALLSKVDANDIPTFESPVNAAGAIITTSFATNGNYTLTDTPSPAAKHAIVFIYTCYFQNFLIAESMQKTEWVGDVIYETDFAATSFLYATNKNIPENKTPAEVRTILNLEDSILAAAVITDHRLIRGNGGVRGVQESTIVVSDNGEMTNLSQPACLIRPATNQENIATDTSVLVVLATEIFDQGNDFASNTFTAPITGKYLVAGLVYLLNIDSACPFYRVEITTSNRTYYFVMTMDKFSGDLLYWTFSYSVIVDMDVSDTCTLNVFQNAGAVQTDISMNTFFSVALIC